MGMQPGNGAVLSKQSVLGLEAEHLHRCLFYCEAPQSLVTSYLQAHAVMPEMRAPILDQLRTINVIVEKRLDAVAIEPWMRQRKRRHILTSKLLLVAYLAECDGLHASFLRGATAGNFTLFLAGLRGGFGLLRGGVQKARHGLV